MKIFVYLIFIFGTFTQGWAMGLGSHGILSSETHLWDWQSRPMPNPAFSLSLFDMCRDRA